MATYCYMAPLPQGGEARARNFIKSEILNNPDHDRFNRESGVTREQVWIQHTPMGDFSVVCIEAKDVNRAFELLARSSDPWAVRFRSFLKEVTGADFSKPMPLNEQIVDWSATEKTGVYNK